MSLLHTQGSKSTALPHPLINIRTRRLGHIGACSHFSAQGRQGQRSPRHGGTTRAGAVAPSRKRPGSGLLPPAEAPRLGLLPPRGGAQARAIRQDWVTLIDKAREPTF